jgi:formylglycine-generating enzyme required for sulfatase activity
MKRDLATSATSWAELRAKLAHLYPDEDAARRVAHDAGVPDEHIPWAGAPIDRWHAVLDEAAKRGLLDAVLAVARREYPDATAMGECDSLGALYARRDELRMNGVDTHAIDAEILRVRRARREGPHPQTAEYLGERYRLVEEVGHGGFASVWRAYDRIGQRVVAVKVLHGQWTRDASRIERFDRGARTLARLRHPNIVQIEQLREEEAGFHYFVLEYVPGGTLRDAVLQKRIPREDALRVVASVGDALEYAHAEGVIHRDVKPANVLLRGDGTGVLTDFDLALLSDSTGGTRSGALGSFLYAAPEAMDNASAVDARADVFSLACTALFVVLGREIQFRDRVDPARALENVPCAEATREAIVRGMADDPAERFGSMRSLVEALRRPMVPLASRRIVVRDPAGGEIPMVWIPPGACWQGGQEGRANEAPRHRCEFDEGFYVGVYPVTVGEFRRFVDATGYDAGETWRAPGFAQNDPHPVVGVSWHDAQAYCRWVGLRLLHEAEWEYVARGADEHAFPWGADAPDDTRLWWSRTTGRHGTCAVGEHPKGASPFGVEDLAGNVWEWVEDAYRSDAYSRRRAAGPSAWKVQAESTPTDLRVRRGGGWGDTQTAVVRATARGAEAPGMRYAGIGFRCARDGRNSQERP